MSGTRAGWRFRRSNEASGNGVALHPFDGIPSYVADQLISDGNDFLGNSGLSHYFDHFVNWRGPVAEGAAGGWLLSGTTGAATVVLGDVPGGTIILTADATGSCNPTLQLGAAATGAQFLYTVGKRMWCFARLKLSTVATVEAFFGLATPDTSPCTTGTLPSDGIFFEKASSETAFNFHARKDGTSTKKSAATTVVLADATYTTIGFQVTTEGNIVPYQNGTALTASVIAAGNANIPVAGDILQPIIGILGASMTMTLDWVYFAQEL